MLNRSSKQACSLADALAACSRRGIFHRDIKPANVLLTDDGQPMLLDFNLAEDTKLRSQGSVAAVGGTLPYMSPEQLEAFGGKSVQVEARSDIYSLGVVLFQMLTGKIPFRMKSGRYADMLGEMTADRLRGAPLLRPINPDITPAVESIIRHCLEPEPANRYQSARDLQEDLDRQLKNLPLKHAPEPSLAERAQKFVRRHPRLTSWTSVSVAAAVLLAILGTSLFVLKERLDMTVAQRELQTRKVDFREFLDDARPAQFILYSKTNDPEQLDKGVKAAEAALAHFPVFDDQAWEKAEFIRGLGAEDQEKVRDMTGELLFLMARAKQRQAEREKDQAEKQAKLETALVLNTLTEKRDGAILQSFPLWHQRAEIAELLGNKEVAERSRQKLKDLNLRTPRFLPRCT